jgi:hypothetical protein
MNKSSRRAHRLVLGLSLLLTVAVVSTNCVTPQQITVRFTTNAGADKPALAIVGGPTPIANAETLKGGAFDATKFDGCTVSGDRCTFGTLAFAPAGGSKAAITAVLALRGKSVDECAAEPNQKGCIIARRRFSYERGQTAEIEVQLDLDCDGVACSVYSTCKSGTCQDSCTGANCEPPLPIDAAVPPQDGQASDVGGDGPSSDSGFIDAGADGTVQDTGAADTGTDAGDSGVSDTGPDARDAAPDAPGGGMCPALTNCGPPAVQGSNCSRIGLVCRGSVPNCAAERDGAGPPELCCTAAALCPAGTVCCIDDRDFINQGNRSICALPANCPAMTRLCQQDLDCEPGYLCQPNVTASFYGHTKRCVLQ